MTESRNVVSMAHAKCDQKRYGFRPYTGPKLSGERLELAPGDSRFPAQLRSIPDPPDRLFVIGNLAALSEGLAIVGARKATPYGLACVDEFGGIAAQCGVTIISGGARGCDSRAHEAALREGALTVAVLGGGCDQIYPASNYRLFQRIIDSGGAVISEHPWEFPALPYAFRMRNRLIAGLARATLIVEAGLPSGTFSTADEALAANRDVLVVPGAITSPTSAGSNRLLYQGALPIVDRESFEDYVVSAFGVLRSPAVACDEARGKRATASDPVLSALLAEPLRLEKLIRAMAGVRGFGADPRARVQVRLAELERDGLIARYPDGRYGPKKVGIL